jgi:chromodomain-helicase-DNA-binding protein 4
LPRHVVSITIMSDAAEDDLSRLFTPPRTPTAASSPLSELPHTPSPPPDPKARQTEIFYIEPPVLNSDEKSKYKTLPPQFVTSGFIFDAPDVDQVIGEYRDGSDLYYFARFQDGIAHKVCDFHIFYASAISFDAFLMI